MTEAVFERSYQALRRIAAVHAARAVRRHRLPADVRLDLEQDAVLELWRKRLNFRECRAGWLTFSEHVIANHLRSQVRSLFAARRGRGLGSPLDEQKDFMAVPDPRIELRIDVERALASVSRFDRAVAVTLADQSVSEASRVLGVSRSTVYKAIERLRARFAGVGLQPHRCWRKWLPTPESSRDESR